jgi:hypothetical protein
MRPAEFEEKEYEFPLYRQLQQSHPVLWPPGQVLEDYLGFDAALLLRDPYIWRLYGRRRPLRGLSPYRFDWPFLPKTHRHRLPRFRANCFVQVKRSEVGTRLPKRLSALGTRRPYFRFSLSTDQQKTLEAAARRASGKALFIYAAPVFGKSRELFLNMGAGTLVQNSTFPDVLSLKGHGAWYYNEPGAHGVPNPDFEAVRLPTFEQQLTRLVAELGPPEEVVSPGAALQTLRDQLQDAVREAEATAEPRGAFLLDEWRDLDVFATRVDLPPAVVSFLAVDAFAAHFNLLWLTVA